MELTLDPELADLVQQARTFARKNFADGQRLDLEERFPEEIWRAAGEAGLLGAFIPKKYGGRGLGFLAHSLVMEEFWRIDPGMGNILLSVFGAELLMFYGSEEQRTRWLPLLARGEAISCCAITEPDAGSDIFSLSTRAVPSDGGWKINGTKQFITNGNRADLILILAVTTPEPEKRTEAFSFLLSEKDSPGLSAEKMTGKLGIRASDTAEVAFRDLLVPGENLLGESPGSGFRQVMHLFNFNRLFACGQGVGAAQGALDLVLAHLSDRKDLASAQTIQYLLADMATTIEAARQLYVWAGGNLDAGRVDPGGVAMAKLFAGETGVRVTRQALGIIGPEAATAAHPLSRFYRDAKIVEIYEGAKDLEKLTIARQLLEQ
jgi:acyl-CoA dehydrogenase